MKTRWLNLVLRLSNTIYQKKQILLTEEGSRILRNVISIFLLEVFLAAVSLPLYVSVKPQTVTAFFEHKEQEKKYGQVVFDYKVRSF